MLLIYGGPPIMMTCGRFHEMFCPGLLYDQGFVWTCTDDTSAFIGTLTNLKLENYGVVIAAAHVETGHVQTNQLWELKKEFLGRTKL